MPTTLIVTVAVAPKGTSISDGVAFTFAPGPGMPVGVISANGLIDLSKDFPSGTAVTLVFTMTTANLQFSSGPSVGKFPVSFYGQSGATNAIWIALQSPLPPKGPYQGSEFVFPTNAMGPNNATISLTDNNDDGKSYNYVLFGWATTGSGQGQKFQDDPRIINHPTNK